MLLARESLNLDRSPQTEGTLLATLLRSPAAIGTFALRISDGRPQEVKVSPDGRSIAAVTNCCGMKIFDARTHQLVRTIPLVNADYAYVPTTGDLFAASPTTKIPVQVLVDPKNGPHTSNLHVQQALAEQSGERESRRGYPRRALRLLRVVDDQKKDRSNGAGYIEAWRLDQSGKSKLRPDRLRRPRRRGPGAAGDRLMIAQSGRITTWDAATMRRIGSVPGPRFTGEFAAVALSPDGRRSPTDSGTAPCASSTSRAARRSWAKERTPARSTA